LKILYKTDLDNIRPIDLYEADIVIEENPLKNRNGVETVIITKNRFGTNGHVVNKLYLGTFLLECKEKWYEQLSNESRRNHSD
jgi:hypothetical protein